MLVRALHEADRPWAAALVADRFGATTVVSRGVLHDTRVLPGLIALQHERRSGLLQYRREIDQLEIVVLIACRPRQGVGRCLLGAAKQVTRAHACRRLWLITTNDNRPARAFYQALGWRQCALHRGAVTEARRLIKPQIPLTGHAGLPIEDEIEFECLIDQPPRARDRLDRNGIRRLTHPGSDHGTSA